MTTPRRRPTTRAVVLGLLLVIGASACGGGTGSAGPSSAGPDTSTTTTTALLGPVSDQTQPKSTFGLSFHDNKVWIADFLGGQVVAADPNSGAILKRYKGEDGVPEQLGDVAVGPEGSVYWSGFNDGQISRMSPANISVVIVGVEAGASGVAFSHDGKLYVTRAVIGDGLWEVDPTGVKKETKLADTVHNMKSFDVGPDGFIYGPQYGIGGKGALVEVDPATGATTPIIDGFDGPISAKMSPDGSKVYVLSLPPAGKPTLDAVDLATKTKTPLPSPQTPLVGGMAVAPDGRIFVSAYNEPTLNIISPDGSVKTIGVGQRT